MSHRGSRNCFLRRRLNLHSSPEAGDVKHASEVGLFFEPSSLASSELRVDQDELWADGLGLHAEGEGSSLTGRLRRLLQSSAQSADESFGTWVRHPEIRKAPRYLVKVTGSNCDAPQQGFESAERSTIGPAQILVKWDDGRSQSVKPGIDRYRIIE